MNNPSLFTFNEIKVTYNRKLIGPTVTSSKDAADYLRDGWEQIDYCESFYVLLLSRGNNILGVAKISTGSVAGTVADPKKIFQIALKGNASAIILAHNHPSGVLKPSSNDNLVTRKCVESGKFLDMPVLDHVILTSESYFSFADEGLM